MGILSRTYPPCRCFVLLVCVFAWLAASSYAQTSATATALVLPGGIAYDAKGNLYLAETGNHVIRLVTPSGQMSIFAGTGVQGFAGDGGPATAALLDSPMGLALDAAGDLFVTDSHNQRVRRIDAATGVITTVAGNGAAGATGDGGPAVQASLNLPLAVAIDGAGNVFVADTRNHRIRRVDAISQIVTTFAGDGFEGFAGDNGPATEAAFDSPSGLAFDAAGNLYVADSRNQRIRRIDHASGLVTTLAGDGLAAFSGDSGQAASAGLNLPRGIAVDALGNVFLADLANQRVRRIDAGSGVITTVAGLGSQLFAGDGQLAVSASLDSPRAVTLSPGGLLTLSDTANQRIRQVDSTAIIHTVAGISGLAPGTLTLTGTSNSGYGAGSVTATLASSVATGSVVFSDIQAGVSMPLATVALTNNAAILSTAALAVGAHTLSASYAGDATHAAAQSAAFLLAVSPAIATAAPAPVALLYGQAVPGLTGTVAGVLAQDSGKIAVAFTSTATQFSAPGSYPIAAVLSGVSAGNYMLQAAGASVTIGPAPSSVTVQLSTSSAPLGTVVSANVWVAASTAGTPTGTVNLLDGASQVGSATISNGAAAFTLSSLATGIHSLTAAYMGDTNFLASASQPAVETVGPAATPDFTLAATAVASQSVLAGTAAAFSFNATQVPSQGVMLASPIQLAVAGLPPGATGSFSPAYLPPGSASAGFTLTIQTPVARVDRRPVGVFVVLAVPVLLLGGMRRRRAVSMLLLALVAVLASSCGARVATEAETATSSSSYAIQVTGTATGPTGSPIVHTAIVTLTVY